MSQETGLTQDTENTLVNQLQQDLTSLDRESQESYWRWLSGETKEPPEVVKRVITNLAQKINVTQGYLTAVSLSRMNRLSVFLQRAEETIFNPDLLGSMDTEEILNLYEAGQKIYQASMENSRKFIYQNKQTMEELEKPVDELKQALLNMPPEKLARIRKIIEEAENETNIPQDTEGSEPSVP